MKIIKFALLLSLIIVTYRDRFQGDPMGAELSVEKTIRLVLTKDRPETISSQDQQGQGIRKVTFDISRIDENGLIGSADAKRAIAYEFCIPDTETCRNEVESIDSSVVFSSGSPGRIGCGEDQILCIGSTHQRNFRDILMKLSELPYVQRIDECFFE